VRFCGSFLGIQPYVHPDAKPYLFTNRSNRILLAEGVLCRAGALHGVHGRPAMD
jgi:hypothetical protein